jgi:hypothetical protein
MTRTRLLLIACVAAALLAGFLVATAPRAAAPADPLNPTPPNRPAGPDLVQPIKYSHKIHAGKLAMDCLYCHTNVDKSPVANLPNVETCMNCHQYVKRREDQKVDSPEIAKLVQYYQEKKTIPWVHVNWLPDHVGFNHQQHVLGGIKCQTCHGQVQDMEVEHRVYKLNMGFCVTCHKANRETPNHPASLDCYTCHK